MTIKEYQDNVDKWIKEYGVRYFDEKTPNNNTAAAPIQSRAKVLL